MSFNGKDPDYTRGFEINSSREIFRNYIQRRHLINNRRLLGQKLSSPDNSASALTVINNGRSHTSPEEIDRYLQDMENYLASLGDRNTFPPPPINLNTTLENKQVVISFDQKGDGGSPITNYNYRINGSYLKFDTPQLNSPITISNLANGSTYTISLIAQNAIGISNDSAQITVTIPATKPEPPTNLVVTNQPTGASITFTPGVDNGLPIINYWYRINSGSYIARSPTNTLSPLVLTGLTPGVSYTIRLKSENALGLSIEESLPVTVFPSTLPNRPTGLSATLGINQISISFTPGSNGGTPVTNYWYNVNGGSFIALSPADAASPISIPTTDLINGVSYTFRLKAQNLNGLSPESVGVTIIPLPPIPSGDQFIGPSFNQNISVDTSSPTSLSSGRSYSFNGSSGHLYLNKNSSWAFETGDFTIEWFHYNSSSQNKPRIFSIGAWPNAEIACSIESGVLFFWFYDSVYQFGANLPMNEWLHIAIVRINGIVRVYRNGVQIGTSQTLTRNFTNTTTKLYIGVENNGTNNISSSYFGGYITNMRIVKGLGIYTGSFTVPTADLMPIQSENPYGGSNTSAIPAGFTKLLLGVPSGNLYNTFTTNYLTALETLSPFPGILKSYKFDYGLANYLTVQGNSSWAFGTGDFTIEFFLYQYTIGSSFPTVLSLNGGFRLNFLISTEVIWWDFFYINQTFGFARIDDNRKWSHWAFVRRNNLIYLYRNGVLANSVNNITNFTNINEPLYLGNLRAGVESGEDTFRIHGNITNMRIVKGLAVYIGNFTPPTGPLTVTASANPFGGSNTQAIPDGYTKLLLTPT